MTRGVKRQPLLGWPLPPGLDYDGILQRRGRPPQDMHEPDWGKIASELKRKGVTILEKILIVEDDALIAADLQDIVASSGYEVVGIADRFASAQRLAPFATIALVDVNLRDEATGPRIAQYLANDFGVAVVMVTANSEMIVTDLSKVIGMISKPAQPKLIDSVLEYLRAIREGSPGSPPEGMRVFA
jgi:CheY-like chemotaxis protein